MRKKLISIALSLSLFAAASIPMTASAAPAASDLPPGTCVAWELQWKSWTDQYGHHEGYYWVCIATTV